MPEIELRSEEVQEIIGRTPNRLVQYGITVIFSIVILLLAGSFFFKYPDVIQARIVLTGDSPPVEIKARTNGKITQFFVQDKQIVKKDEILGIIENTTVYDDFKTLKTANCTAENGCLRFTFRYFKFFRSSEPSTRRNTNSIFQIFE